jgi:ubiquinone/menaquinone biosynthesis C-methylase UbiE
MHELDLHAKEQLDLSGWQNSEHESAASDSVYNIINKMTDVPSMLECQQKFAPVFEKASDILELGGGQGWASCVLKRLHPQARFTMSDISAEAVASLHKWERMFSVSIEKSFSCRSYEIPAPDASYDCVFTYAAAHHFMAHRRTLKEIHRVLRPGGEAFYFHEPSCRPWAYRFAYARVNRIRIDGVPEDVLISEKILRVARECGLVASIRYEPTLHKRRPKEFLYYSVLRTFPFLQKFFPCTATFRFVKEA